MHYIKELIVTHPSVDNGRRFSMDISTTGIDGEPDCQVGNFAKNFFFRTPYGVNRKMYKSEKNMEKAIEKMLKHNGFTIIGWELEK